MPMTEDEKREAVVIAENLGPVQISETLEDLIARERGLLDATSDPDMRAITLHNIAVLTAACAGYMEAAKNFLDQLAQAKERCDGEKPGGVDEDSL